MNSTTNPEIGSTIDAGDIGPPAVGELEFGQRRHAEFQKQPHHPARQDRGLIRASQPVGMSGRRRSNVLHMFMKTRARRGVKRSRSSSALKFGQAHDQAVERV